MIAPRSNSGDTPGIPGQQEGEREAAETEKSLKITHSEEMQLVID